MADAVKPGARLFVDTGYFLALALPRDVWNGVARKWARRSKRRKYRLVTTQAVLRERGLTHALSADRHFEQAGFVTLLSI